jgi:HSP20 family protein
MALLRWDPFTALARMDTEFDDLVRRTFGGETFQYVPPVEMATEGSDVVITMEVPGVDVGDIDIEVNDGRLTITFRRTFQLPEGVTADQIEADADKGLLRLRVKNVTKPVAPPQKIAIKGLKQAKVIEASATEKK